jgi:hypothetical protein
MAEQKKGLTREDLLKFSKVTELAIRQIVDDSSGGDGGTEVKELHLTQKITATGSIPTPDGGPMTVTHNVVYVAADNIDAFLKDVEEKDGILVYKGTMHLDVSKPSGRTNSAGQFTITKPAKIWLTATKFSRGGAALRTAQTQNLNTMINTMFKGGATLDLGVETTGTTNAGEQKEPTVVANGTKETIPATTT